MCKQTESIAKLTEALVKAQAVMETASKDADNPFFKSKYTTLAGCWDVARKPLSDNGLAVIQTTTFEEGNSVIVETTLSHVSGEWVRGALKMPLVKLDPQAVGSAITYARRYALSAMVGIVSDDDDGESAMGHTPTPQAKPVQAQQSQAKAPAKEETPKDKLIKQAYGVLINGLKMPKEEMLSYLKGVIGRDGIKNWHDLTEDELKEVISVARRDAEGK